MAHKLSKLSLIILAGLTALVVACGPAAAPTGEPGSDTGNKASPTEKKDGAAATEKQPKKGGTLTVVSTDTLAPADPAMSQTPYNVWYYAGNPMLYRDPQTWELQPGLIESWKVSPDGKEITLNVRKGVKWHNKPPINGRELEAKDIVYTLKSNTGQQYPELPSLRFPRKGTFAAMDDAVAVDKYTVKVTMKSPSVSFMHGLADYRGAWVVPDGIREAFGSSEALIAPDPARDIGTGPWVMKKFQQLVEVVYERNPDYYKKGLPYLDRVQNVFIPDTSTQNAAFITGQIPYRDLNQDADREFITKQKKDAVIKQYEPGSCWYRMAFNTERKPLNDLRVRRALALMVDYKKIGENVIGSYQGQTLWRYPGIVPFVFPEAIPQEELAKMQLFQGPTPDNVAEAKKLLKEAGYESGFNLEFIMGKTAAYTDPMQMYQQDVEKNLPGVKIKISTMDASIHRERAAQGDYDVQMYCHIHDVTSVAHTIQAFHSQGGRNYPRLKDAKVDNLLDKAEMELDDAKRKALMREVQMYLYDNALSFIPVYHGMRNIALQPWLRGFRVGPGTSYLMLVDEWWFDK